MDRWQRRYGDRLTLGVGSGRLLLRGRTVSRRGDYLMSVVDFEDLQALSGYRQPSKVIDWLSGKGMQFVIGGDGKPGLLTTS